MAVSGVAVRRRAGVAGAVLLALLGASAPALAQADSGAPAPRPARPAPIALRWGKWAAVALAAGFTAFGNQAHNDGNAAWNELVSYCRFDATCTIGPDGRYLDPHAEATYQRVVRDDRTARVLLVGGQVAAVAGAVLWVLDLAHAGEPPNIPYSGLMIESGHGVTKVGWRVPL